MERVPRPLHPAEDDPRGVPPPRRLLIVSSVHDEIWQQLPPDRGHDAAVHERVMRVLEAQLREDARVLDIGSGDGALAARIAARGAGVTGLDPSPTALARAREAHPQLRWVAPADDGSLPLPDAGFDVVTCVNVLQHVADTQSLLSEARRVLAGGGLLLVAVPFHGRLRNAWTALTSFERHFDPLAPVLRFYTARSLRSLLRDLGFEHVGVQALGGPPLVRETLVASARRG